MSSFERTIEDKRKSGDHQGYGIGHSRNALDACFEARFIAAECFHKNGVAVVFIGLNDAA